MTRLKGWLFGLALILLPLLLGVLVVGPQTPVGRNGSSVTAIGHKAYRLLLESFGFEVHRFARGVETLPPLGRSAFVAIEPGPMLFREQGTFAHGLLRWVEAGNSALLTLGPDPDRSAETDDREQLFGTEAERAIGAAKAIEAEAKSRTTTVAAPVEKPATRARAVLRPEESESWPAEDLGAFLGLQLQEGRLRDTRSVEDVPLMGPLVEALGERPTLRLTRPRTFVLGTRSATAAAVLLEAQGRPLVLEVRRGKGRILLLSEPRLLHNGAIGRAAHARLGVALADRLFDRPGLRTIHLEEWSHGQREAEGIFALVVGTRLKWLVAQLLLLAAAWIAWTAPRRRASVPFEVPSRRSKEEVIEALATLHLRSGDLEGAGRALIDLHRRRLGRLVGAPGASQQALARAIAERLGRQVATVEAAFAPGFANAKALIERSQVLGELGLLLERGGRPG